MQNQHNKKKKLARKENQNENQKRKTLDLDKSLNAEKRFCSELIETQKLQLELLQESEKQFQAFHSEMWGKTASKRDCRKTKDRDFFGIWQNARTG